MEIRESAGWTLHASGDMRIESESAARCTYEQYSVEGNLNLDALYKKMCRGALQASLKNAGLWNMDQRFRAFNKCGADIAKH